MTVTLYCMPYSPWSERARWALDHHRITYRKKIYTPLLDEAVYRATTGRFTAHVTVPALVTPEGTVCESLEIAKWAERNGRGTPLFPAGKEMEIARWAALEDEAIAAARALVTRRTAKDAAARMENVPRPLRVLGPIADAMARMGIFYFRKKYALDSRSDEADVAVIRSACEQVRAALSGAREYIFDAFSFADICAATILQSVLPVSDAFIPLEPATRATWTTPELRRDFDDLLTWRDRIYARHRKA